MQMTLHCVTFPCAELRIDCPGVTKSGTDKGKRETHEKGEARRNADKERKADREKKEKEKK